MTPIGWGLLVFIASGLVWVRSSFGAASQQLTGKAVTAALWVYLSRAIFLPASGRRGGDSALGEDEDREGDKRGSETVTRNQTVKTKLVEQLREAGYSDQVIRHILRWYGR